jgi:nucleoside-diphosphate-sugar epimerase
VAKVFLAGASGAIGRRLVPMLRSAGHQVTGTTRSEANAEAIRAAGAEAIVVDATDTGLLAGALAATGPEVVINQLTALPADYDVRNKHFFDETNHLRGEVAPALARAAADAGAKRLISQSIAFSYDPEGDWIKDEEAPFGSGRPALVNLESATLETPGVDGIVLRYGWLYGAGTWFASDGSIADQVRHRRFPQVGKGTGIFPFIHVDDAATATLAAVERGPAGVYNIVDDAPAPMREWLPEYAQVLGAKRPRRVPLWVARRVAGPEIADRGIDMRGASNAKVKRELGWEPRYASWRQGFREALG